MKTIVLGYNDTDSSNRALDRAVDLAAKYGARLVVTSVRPVVIGSDPSLEPGEELEAAEARAGKQGVEAELVEAIGDVAEAIAQVAEANGADLIVVGTRELSMVERLLGHSVSEQLQRRVHTDILIVH
jgi:nucleotide-binding universal stress UspA family protein